MTHKALLEMLTRQGLPFVVIGGTAMRLYNSPRLTHDIDIAIRTLDVDTVIELMYQHGYVLVCEVDEQSVRIVPEAAQARSWTASSQAGSLSFILFPVGSLEGKSASYISLPFSQVNVNSQVDFLFELSLPVLRLLQHARRIDMGDFTFAIPGIEDLIQLKQQRSDRSPVDDDDVRFLQKLLADRKES